MHLAFTRRAYGRAVLASPRSSTPMVLAGAAVLGVLLGVGSLSFTPSGRETVSGATRSLAVAAGVVRRRPPRPGDSWGGCEDARIAGTAPIYRGEPGYRDDMDGDGDGIACEPRRG